MAPQRGAQVLPRAPLLHCVGSYLYIACHCWFNAHKRNFKNTNGELRIALALQCRRHYCHNHGCPMCCILVYTMLSIALLIMHSSSGPPPISTTSESSANPPSGHLKFSQRGHRVAFFEAPYLYIHSDSPVYTHKQHHRYTYNEYSSQG